jgi:uncharacterized membrane protein (UPF0127 family)
MTKIFKKPSVALVGLGFVLVIALFLRLFVPVQHRTILVHETVIRAEVAATGSTRKNGLSGRQSLGAGEGMLFLFPLADRYPFWMIDMEFPIDIIWIRGRTVVDIAANVPPPIPGTTVADLPLYFPRLPADKVLEISAGAAKRAGIKIGDELHGI